MRVTQSMLSNNTLRHMSNSYQNLGEIQDQLATGKKITRASQDPVVAMNGMRYRSQVTEVEQFQRNLGEVYNWMDTADATLDKVTQTLHRIRELTVQASNDTYETTQRANIGKEIEQLREHLVSLANTKSNNKYIFNGTNTTTAPVNPAKMDINVADLPRGEEGDIEGGDFQLTYNGELYRYVGNNTFATDPNNPVKTVEIQDGNKVIHQFENKDGEQVQEPLKKSDIVISDKNAVSTNGENVAIEVLKGVDIAVNINPGNVFSNDFFGDILRLEKVLKDPATTSNDLNGFIDNISHQMDKVVNERAELGARYNRVEMIEDRIMEQQVIAQRILSNNEDADMEKVIIDLMSQESVHRAALSAGSRIIQPTLMDFLR